MSPFYEKNQNLAPFGLYRKGAFQGAPAINKNFYNMVFLPRCPKKISAHSVYSVLR